MKGDDVVRLLVIETSLEEAESVLSTLRNAGTAVRPSGANDLDEVQAALERQPLDLILLNTAHRELTISAISDAVTRSGKDIPLLALLDNYSVEQLVDALQHGAATAVASDSPEHVHKAVLQEMQHLKSRRRLRMLEASLRETEKRCHALLDSSRDAIAYVHEGMHVYANQAYLNLFNYDEFDDLEGLPILDMVGSENSAQMKEALRQLSKGDKAPESIEVNLKLPNGSTKGAFIEFSSASVEGEPCTQLVLRDKSVDPALAKQFEDLKTRDLVTGLHNRQYILHAIGESISAVVQGKGPRSIIYMDVDNFKETVDQVGLGGVDRILGDLAEVIRKNLSDSDLPGRFADQSFAILCHNRDLAGAEKLAETIRKDVEQHISEVGDKSVTLTCSIGVTTILENTANAQDLLTIASSAARSAAANGGNEVIVHDPVKQKPGGGGDDLQWLAVVTDALRNDRLSLAYQPIVSLHGEEGQYYEVLLRLKAQNGEEVLPGEFLPAIQDHELMLKVDRWVMAHALESLRRQQEASGQKVTFFVKLTQQTLADATVLPWFAKVMQKFRLSGDSIVLEMPESKLMTNLKPARQFLKGLKQLHVQFAIEQFGSGLNSFQILKHLPADYLKVDRTFMRDLPKNSESQEKIKEISDQAHSQGKITIAEFVEDAASMSILWQCGVNFVQGNFLQQAEKDMTYDFA